MSIEEAERQTEALAGKLVRQLAHQKAPVLLAITACLRIAGRLSARCAQVRDRRMAVEMAMTVFLHHYDEATPLAGEFQALDKG